jgi:glycerol uptake facilitator-like aquaporin
MLSPAPAVSPGIAFIGEVVATFILCFAIYTFVSHKALIHWTPAMATLVVGILVCVDGNVSGCGMNPARWFGPAASMGEWTLYWVYLFAPLLGSLVAGWLRRCGLFGSANPSTGKLYHDPRYRSVFKHDLELSNRLGTMRRNMSHR